MLIIGGTIMPTKMLAPKQSDILLTEIKKKDGATWTEEVESALHALSTVVYKYDEHPQYRFIQGHIDKTIIIKICGNVKVTHRKGMKDPGLPRWFNM